MLALSICGRLMVDIMMIWAGQSHLVCVCSYKKTVVYDPLKSETYRAIQEDNMGYQDQRVHEQPQPVQTRVFHPNRMIPNRVSVWPLIEAYLTFLFLAVP